MLVVGELERWYMCARIVRWFAGDIFVSGVDVLRGGVIEPFCPVFLLCLINSVPQFISCGLVFSMNSMVWYASEMIQVPF